MQPESRATSRSRVICGHCGAILDSPSARCRNCGTGPEQLTPLRQPPKPWLAALLAALIPGLGHIYLGDYHRGLFYLAAAGGLEFLGLDLDLTALGLALGIPMGLGGLGFWAHGMYDAYRKARVRRTRS